MRRLLLLVCLALWCSPAAAQIPVREPPGPYVIDLRGATAGLPSATPFYPPTGSTIAISSRGFGWDVGGHVYFTALGLPRLGLGASFLRVRGSSPDAATAVELLAPQVSFNFGTGSGWSYVGAGIGTGRVETEVGSDSGPAIAETRSLRSINFGGGARWFVSDRFGVGFDVRLHWLSAGTIQGTDTATPRVTVTTVSVGISVK